MTNRTAPIDTSSRMRNAVPAEFLRVQDSFWHTAQGEVEGPTAIFRIQNNTLGLNLHAITDMIVTCQKEAFGVEVVYHNEDIDPNMLVMGALSVAATLQAWHEAQSTK